MIMSNINASQRNSKAKLKDLHNNEKKINNIINILIKTSTLKKEKSKNYSWKKIILKLIQCLQNKIKEKDEENYSQNIFITENVL